MEQNIDLKIKEMAKQEKVILPSSYNRNLNKAIDTLEQRVIRKKWYYSKYKLAAILSIVLLAGISVTAVAAVNLYRARMEQLSEQEKTKLNDEVQQSSANADSYSRELTSSEQERMEQLTKQYENDGVFPQGSLLQVTDTEQLDTEKVCFLSDTSTFYLPDYEMSDEELLQIIDFTHKRDYSVMEINKTTSKPFTETEATPSSNELTKQEAEQKALELVALFYNVDVTEYAAEASFSPSDDSANEEPSLYRIELSNQDNPIHYYVQIDAKGTLEEIRIQDSQNNIYQSGIEFNKEECIKNQSFVTAIIKDALNLTSNVDKTYLEYNLDSEGKLAKGNVTYSVKMKDGSGYLFRYSLNTNYIYNILYVPDFEDYVNSTNIIAENQKNSGITHKSELIVE